jgi:hypothetical protein
VSPLAAASRGHLRARCRGQNLYEVQDIVAGGKTNQRHTVELPTMRLLVMHDASRKVPQMLRNGAVDLAAAY